MKRNVKYKLLKSLAIFISLVLMGACGGRGSGDRSAKSIIPSASALKSNRPSGIVDGVYTLHSVFDRVNDAQNCMTVDRNQREKTQVITVIVEGSTCTVTSAVEDPDKNILDLKVVRGQEVACKISGNSIVIETRFTMQLGNSCSAAIHEVLRADANNGHVVNDCQTQTASENKVLFNANVAGDENTFVGCAGFESHYSSECSDQVRTQNGCQYLASIVMVPGDPNAGDGDGPGPVDPVDADGDGIPNESDNCPNEMNADQVDANRNAVGDACEGEDRDGDGYSDMFDNCPWVANHDQGDANGNGWGDACEQPIVDEDGNVIGVGVPGGVPYDDLARRLGHALDFFRNPGDGNGDGVVEGDAGEDDPVRLTESCRNSNECSNGQECVAGRCFDVPQNNACGRLMMRQNCVCIAQRNPGAQGECGIPQDCGSQVNEHGENLGPMECFAGQCIPTADYCTDHQDAPAQGRRAVEEQRARDRAACEARPHHILSGDQCVCDIENGYVADADSPGGCGLQEAMICENQSHRSWRNGRCQCDQGYAPLPGSDAERPTCRSNAEVACESQQGHVWSTARRREGCQCDDVGGYVPTADPPQNGIPVCESRQARDARIRQERERLEQLQEDCNEEAGHIWVEDHCECDFDNGYLDSGSASAAVVILFDIPESEGDIPTCVPVVNKRNIDVHVGDERPRGTDAEIYLRVCKGPNYPRNLPDFGCAHFSIHREQRGDDAFEQGTYNDIDITVSSREIIPYSPMAASYTIGILTEDRFENTSNPDWLLNSIEVSMFKADFHNAHDSLPSYHQRIEVTEEPPRTIGAAATEVTVLDTCLNQWMETYIDEFVDYVDLPNQRGCH